MQFPTEFEWLSPSGRGVLTAYMPTTTAPAGRWTPQPTLAEADGRDVRAVPAAEAGRRDPQRAAAGRHRLHPAGKWVTEIHRDWNTRYVWPRFVCALPRDFFAAVRDGAGRRRGRRASPQTRDMNPIYTGKDVSFIDTKQAQRDAEALLATPRSGRRSPRCCGRAIPHAALDKAWRQLVYGAHHDGITGSESDQVYLDLLAGWREAHDLAGQVLDRSLAALCEALPVAAGDGRRIVVFNPPSWARTDLVEVRVELPAPGTCRPRRRRPPVLLEHAATPRRRQPGRCGRVFRAADVPPRRLPDVAAAPADGSRAAGGCRSAATGIANEHVPVTVDPARGGCVSALVDLRTGREILPAGRGRQRAAGLRRVPGPPALPARAPGTWCRRALRRPARPTGRPTAVTRRAQPARAAGHRHRRASDRPATPSRSRCGTASTASTLTTRVDELTGSDQLVRVRCPAAVPGALPVSEVGNAVIGRGFGFPDVDSEPAPWTLDNPAYQLVRAQLDRVDVRGPAGSAATPAPSASPRSSPTPATPTCRDLVVALVRRGVTATTSTGTGPRYGLLAVDSNLPDFRIAVGGPEDNAFTAEVLAAAGRVRGRGRPAARRDRAAPGCGCRPTGRSTEVWVPNADLPGVRDLPVLVVADALGRAERRTSTGAVEVSRPSWPASPDPDLDDRTVGLLNRGMPGFVVDTDRRPAPVAAALLHRLAVRRLDRPAAPHAPRTARASSCSTGPTASTTRSSPAPATGGRPTSCRPGTRSTIRCTPASPPVGPSLGAESFVRVEPERGLIVTAFKPAGNPIAGGRRPGERIDRVTARVYEPYGQPVSGRIGLYVPVTRTETVEPARAADRRHGRDHARRCRDRPGPAGRAADRGESAGRRRAGRLRQVLAAQHRTGADSATCR